MQKEKKTPIYEHAFYADFSASGWDEVAANMARMLLSPFLAPFLILISKLLGRPIRFMEYWTGLYEEDNDSYSLIRKRDIENRK